MSDEPRDLHPGTTYAVLRDVRDGRCGLPPDVDTKQMLGFLLGCVQQRVDAMSLHAFRSGPNFCLYVVTHWTEPNRAPPPTMSGAPAFFREYHRLVALNRNVRTGESGHSFWSNKKPIMIELPTAEDVWDVLVEMDLLHLSAGITTRAWRDPYLKFGPRDIGKSHSFASPPDLERAFMPLPSERTTVTITAPPVLAHLSREAIVSELQSRRASVREELAAVERDYLELDATSELDRSVRRPMPEFSEASLLSRRRTPWKNHFVESHDRATRESRRSRRATFLRDHRRMLEQLRRMLSTGDGNASDIAFPAGTWGAWQHVWARVEQANQGRSPPPPAVSSDGNAAE